MDFLQKIGGRKFLMALITLGIAVYLELSGRGLSPSMASFMVAVIGSFHIANYAATKNFLDNKNSGRAMPDDKLNDLVNAVQKAVDPATTQNLQNILISISTGMQDLKNVSLQTSTAVLNLSKEVAKRG